ncbi:MAG: hypothetical protein ACRC33_12640 [Gemmataceae bacterium]
MASVICHGCGKAFDPPQGYTRVKIQCPGCGVICAVPAAGAKRATAPAGKKAAKAAPAGEDEDWLRDAPKLAPPKHEEPIDAVAEDDAPVPSMELDDAPEDVAAEESEDGAYQLRDKLGPKCPKCKAELPEGGVVCVKCGYNRKTKKQAERRYTTIDREWESDRPLASRLMWLGAAQAFHVVLGVVCYWQFETVMPAVISWFPLTAMLCFLLGTYDRIRLTRDTKGRVRVEKQWRFAFVPLKPEKTDVRGYEGVVSGPWMETGVMEWYVLVSLLMWGIIPGLIWYWQTIASPHYMVALAQDHGRPEFYVYRGRNPAQVNEIAEAICSATGLERIG